MSENYWKAIRKTKNVREKNFIMHLSGQKEWLLFQVFMNLKRLKIANNTLMNFTVLLG